MRISILRVVAAAAPLIGCGAAHSGFVGLSIEQLPMDEVPGLLTWRVYAQFDGTQGQNGEDFIFAVADCDPVACPLEVRVLSGTFFQHHANSHGMGDLSPDPALCGDDPTVCLDTFVTIGAETSVGDATGLAPGWDGFGSDELIVCGSGWYITPKYRQGLPDRNDRVLIMQLSTQDGVGFVGSGCGPAGFSDGIAFQECLSFDTGCHADVDGDGLIGIGDVLLVIAQWGACPPTCLGDVTANGEVGIYDLLEVLAEWGPCG